MLLDKVRNYVDENNLIESGDRIVVGVSGGADSVALFRVLHKMRREKAFDMVAVHIHHGVRGSEADRDRLFVEKLCEHCDVKCLTYEFDVPAIAEATGTTVEEAGRNVRYDTFKQVMKEEKCNKTAVAHNANDNVETILYNLLRGSGITGLTGIKSTAGYIIRPLLTTEREEIEHYLSEIGQQYCTDSTNLSEDYMRNKIRLNLIPYIEENINTCSSEHILNLSRQLDEINDYINMQADDAYEKCVSYDKDGKQITVGEKFFELNIAIKKLVVRKAVCHMAGKLKDITSVHIESVLDLCNKQVGKAIQLPYGLIIQKTYDGFIIRCDNCTESVQGTNEKNLFELVPTAEEQFIEGVKGEKFCLKLIKKQNLYKIEEKMYTKWLDYDKIKGKLIVRNRMSGDYIQINSSGGTKKLKDYFIDMKIPAEERDEVTLFADGQHIIWAVGYRISEKYKITEDTENILVIECKKEDNDG